MDVDEALIVAQDVCETPARRALAVDALCEEVERLRTLARAGNCGAGHDPERVCCECAAALVRVRVLCESRRRLGCDVGTLWPSDVLAALDGQGVSGPVRASGI